MIDQPKYKATHYNYKAWQIEQWIVPTKEAKNQTPYWKVIKYPGTLENALDGLLDLHTADFTVETVNDAQSAIAHARAEILANLQEVFCERQT